MKEVSIADIETMPYTDFVGLVNQWNVLPGAYSTISKWSVFGRVIPTSHVLDIACTTGFSLRELSLLNGCSGEGIDISVCSVEMANYNKEKYAPKTKLNYSVADGYEFEPKQRPTHVVIGASLQFFRDPQKMMERIIGFLGEEGIILASPFFAVSELPKSVLEQSRCVFGITPTATSYKETMKRYASLEILSEDKSKLVKETDEEITSYCHSTIERACKIRNINNKKLYDVMFDRLFAIKKASNDLREHQEYSALVLRYRASTYPHRYVELF